MPRALARSSSAAWSAITTRAASKGCRANAQHKSRPMPAGSPDVMMMRGKWVPTMAPRLIPVFQAKLDIGPVTQFTYPVLIGFFGITRTYLLTFLEACSFLGYILLAALNDLNKVEQKRKKK